MYIYHRYTVHVYIIYRGDVSVTRLVQSQKDPVTTEGGRNGWQQPSLKKWWVRESREFRGRRVRACLP